MLFMIFVNWVYNGGNLSVCRYVLLGLMVIDFSIIICNKLWFYCFYKVECIVYVYYNLLVCVSNGF